MMNIHRGNSGSDELRIVARGNNVTLSLVFSVFGLICLAGLGVRNLHWEQYCLIVLGTLLSGWLVVRAARLSITIGVTEVVNRRLLSARRFAKAEVQGVEVGAGSTGDLSFTQYYPVFVLKSGARMKANETALMGIWHGQARVQSWVEQISARVSVDRSTGSSHE